MSTIDWLICVSLGVASALSLVVLVHRGRRFAVAAVAVFVGASGLATVTIVSELTSPEMQVQHQELFRLMSWVGVCVMLGRLGWRRDP